MRLLFLCLILSGSASLAQDEPSAAEVAKLRETISRIVDVKSTTSSEIADWEAQKESMAGLLELQRRELELLDEELEKSGKSAGGHDEKLQTTEEELDALKAARRLASEAVIKSRPRLLSLLKAFPQPLLDEIEVQTVALNGWSPGDEARDGLQAMLGILSEAERFNRRITRAIEERQGRQVEVLYLGLARGYYVDRSGNAGVGVPGRDGWTWTSDPTLADELLKALDELDKKRPPELVKLPVQILEVK